MSRLRYAGVTGTVGSGNMTNSATSHTFTAPLTYANGVTVPTLAGTDYFLLSILSSTGTLSEIVKVTAYNSSTGAATIVRGQEGTSGVSHTSGDKVTMAQYATDSLWTTALASVLNSTTNPSLTGWTAGTGTWTAETDRFRLNSSATNAAMRLHAAGRVPFSSADVQIDIRVDVTTSNVSCRAGIVFGTPIGSDAGGGLLVALASAGSTTQVTKIHTEVDAIANVLDVTPTAINHGTWITLRVVRMGNVVDVYINGTLAASPWVAANSTPTVIPPIDMGRFALVGFGVDASFRNLTYNSLTLP